MIYVLINKNSNKVVKISDKIFSEYSDNLILCQVESIPTDYDYLIAENIHLVEEKLDNEVISSCYTCNLVAKFRPTPSPEQEAKIKDKRYSELVSRYVRQKYSQNDVEAILSNYAEDPSDTEYLNEFNEFQSYRKECKAKAHKEVYGE